MELCQNDQILLLKSGKQGEELWSGSILDQDTVDPDLSVGSRKSSFQYVAHFYHPHCQPTPKGNAQQ